MIKKLKYDSHAGVHEILIDLVDKISELTDEVNSLRAHANLTRPIGGREVGSAYNPNALAMNRGGKAKNVR
jgi:hypothetical protein